MTNTTVARFYTLPPSSISYPYLLINANRPQRGLRYLREHYKQVESVIIDAGVEIFRDPSIFDYPLNHMRKLLRLYNTVKRRVGEVWVVCPDYPDDYNPRSLWISEEITNIERTVENVLKCREIDANWLIPIQGHNEQPESILQSIELYDKLGILDEFNYFAIANLCVSKSLRTIVQTINLASLFLPTKRLHAFGISLAAAKKLQGKLFSWDSMAWTFPRGRGKWSAKTQKEREQYFLAYLEAIQ